MKTFLLIINIVIIAFLVALAYDSKDIIAEKSNKALAKTKPNTETKEWANAIPLNKDSEELFVKNFGKCILQITNKTESDVLIESVTFSESNRTFTYVGDGYLLKYNGVLSIKDSRCTINNSSIIYIETNKATYVWSSATI